MQHVLQFVEAFFIQFDIHYIFVEYFTHLNMTKDDEDPQMS